MYPTSTQYQAAVYADERQIAGKVTFAITDVTAYDDITGVSSTAEEAGISDVDQVTDQIRNVTFNLATLEPDRFRLDGSFSFADDVTPANNGQMGFVSDQICEAASDNLLPPVTLWSRHVNAAATGLHKLTLTSTGLFQSSTVWVPGLPGVTYTLSGFPAVSSGGYGQISFVDENKTFISGNIITMPVGSCTGTAPPGTAFIQIDISNNTLGTFVFENMQLQVGAVVTAFGLQDKGFMSPPAITITFGGLHSSAGLTVTFDPANGEYATHFNASAYNASNVLIDSVDVADNTLVQCVLLGQLLNYKKIIITIYRWSVGSRRARVLEVDFGLVEVYTGNELISMNLVEELDLTTSALPSAEFRFTVDNSDRAFNILNPTGFYKYLQQRQQITAELGINVGGGFYEYVPLGRYLLWEWTSDEGSLTASFTTRTNLDLMSNYDYERLVASTKTLHQLAVELFAACDISNYEIDPALLAVSTNSLAKKTDCRTMLQMIAIAGGANIYVSRSNVITLKVVSLGVPVDDVTFDNTYAEPQILLDRITKQVDVTYWTDLDTSGVSSVAAAGVDIGDTLKLEGNTLINTSGRATAVATWLLAQKQYRAKYSINWRGNMAHELGDSIAIENSYDVDMDGIITRNELGYQGYLAAKTEARGVVN